MAENIKIHRNPNRRLGFSLNQNTISNFYVDELSLHLLVNHINKQFLICSNKQSECLLKGTVDLNNKFITFFGVMLVLPLIKSLLLQNFEYLFMEYLFLFIICMVVGAREFRNSDIMKDNYLQAEIQLSQRFDRIREEFNQRFQHLKMEYRHSYNQEEQDYLEIKVVSKPKEMYQLEERMKKYIQLLPVQ